jgi:hypothetical protein
MDEHCSHHGSCLNCQALLTGEYCANCGQAAHEGHAPTLGHVFHELVHEIVHVDGKIFRSVRAMLFSPGLLTVEYWAGHILSWVRPLRLFLIAAALHLLLSSNTVGPMNFQVILSKNSLGEQNLSIGQDPEKTQLKGNTPLPASEQQAFFAKFRKLHSSIRYSSVLLFAVPAWLLYRRQQPHFPLQLVFSLHYYAFWYLLSIVGGLNATMNKLTLPLAMLYLLPMVRRVYGHGWIRTLLSTAFLWAALVLIETALGFGSAMYVMKAGGGAH